jgi:hypothetical protein
MKTEYLIAVDDFCVNHNIEISFISALHQSGLIEIISKKEKIYLESTQLQQVEKFIRFYYEFDINLEGIETITHLLQRLNNQQEEITTLRNRLRLYEAEE